MPAQIDVWVREHPGHGEDDPWLVSLLRDRLTPREGTPSPNRSSSGMADLAPAKDAHPPDDDLSRGLQQRLDNANAYFWRKAAEVFTDDDALRLLAVLYQDSVIDLADFNHGPHGIPLAKLAAANFCEIGANVIYITESGRRFIDSVKE